LEGALVEVVASHPNVCKYIDMPLQHANAEVLQRMRRPGAVRTEHILERLRSEIPGLVLRTTFIVGFPGETEAEFNELCRFVEQQRFERVGVFVYSSEEGTPAFALADDVPAREKQRRRKVLMELQQGISHAHNQAAVGKVLDVIVDHLGSGRDASRAPEIDGVVRFRGQAQVGQFASVRIERATPYDLYGALT